MIEKMNIYHKIVLIEYELKIKDAYPITNLETYYEFIIKIMFIIKTIYHIKTIFEYIFHSFYFTNINYTSQCLQFNN